MSNQYVMQTHSKQMIGCKNCSEKDLSRNNTGKIRRLTRSILSSILHRSNILLQHKNTPKSSYTVLPA